MIDPTTKKPVLIFRTGSIGDTIVALPALRHIKNSQPDRKLHILTNFPVTSSGKACPLSQVIDGSGVADNYIEYPTGKLGLMGLFRLISLIRSIAPTTLIYLMPIRTRFQLLRDWFLFKACGISRIIGLKFSRSSQTRLHDPHHERWEHEAQRLARLISDLGPINLDTPQSWDLALSSTDRDQAHQHLGELSESTFIAMSIGTKVDAKDWGEPNWLNLTNRLTNTYPGVGLILVGSQDEFDRCEKVAQLWRGPVVNLCGKLSPRASAAALDMAILFVGHDSGPMHLAAAVGTPVVAIFSARNKPGEWYPWGVQHQVLYNKTDCFGCRLDTCVTQGKRCILGISVDQVLTAIIKYLPQG